MLKDIGNCLILRNLMESDRESLLEHVKNVFDSNQVGGSVVLLTKQLLDYYPRFSMQDNFVVSTLHETIKL